MNYDNERAVSPRSVEEIFNWVQWDDTDFDYRSTPLHMSGVELSSADREERILVVAQAIAVAAVEHLRRLNELATPSSVPAHCPACNSHIEVAPTEPIPSGCFTLMRPDLTSNRQGSGVVSEVEYILTNAGLDDGQRGEGSKWNYYSKTLRALLRHISSDEWRNGDLIHVDADQRTIYFLAPHLLSQLPKRQKIKGLAGASGAALQAVILDLQRAYDERAET